MYSRAACRGRKNEDFLRKWQCASSRDALFSPRFFYCPSAANLPFSVFFFLCTSALLHLFPLVTPPRGLYFPPIHEVSSFSYCISIDYYIYTYGGGTSSSLSFWYFFNLLFTILPALLRLLSRALLCFFSFLVLARALHVLPHYRRSNLIAYTRVLYLPRSADTIYTRRS